MTFDDLEKAKKLSEKINELSDNVELLDYALNHEGGFNGKIKRFFLSCTEKNKVHIGGECVSFGGRLSVTRESLELLKNHFKEKLNEKIKEFENIGKD